MNRRIEKLLDIALASAIGIGFGVWFAVYLSR